jgi:hypothetical protein
MDRSVNPRLARLEVLVGEWELTASSGERIMSTSRSTFQWFGDRGFLIQRIDPQTYLAPEWVGGAPTWVDAVIGLDDHSDTFTMLYADSGGACRAYQKTNIEMLRTLQVSSTQLLENPAPYYKCCAATR